MSQQFLLSITGEIGAGKSYISQKIKELGQSKGIDVHVIDIDKIDHQILGELLEPLYIKTREEIAQIFGNELMSSNTFINRKKLGEIIFHHTESLDKFNAILYKLLLLRLRRELYEKRGLIILDSALISESKMSYLTNNHSILVKVNQTIQRQRLVQRGYTDKQIVSRLNSQFNESIKKKMILECIEKDYHGKLWEIENSDAENNDRI